MGVLKLDGAVYHHSLSLLEMRDERRVLHGMASHAFHFLELLAPSSPPPPAPANSSSQQLQLQLLSLQVDCGVLRGSCRPLPLACKNSRTDAGGSSSRMRSKAVLWWPASCLEGRMRWIGMGD